MKDIDGEIMFNLYVESLRETRLSDEMPHIGDGRPTTGMTSDVVSNPDNELYSPEMYQQLVVQFGTYVNLYHTAGSEQAREENRAGALDAAMKLTNFVKTRDGAEQIAIQLKKMGADTQAFTNALARESTGIESNVQPVIEEGIREFFRGMTMMDVVDKIKARLDPSRPLSTSSMEAITNGLLMFSLPFAIGKGGRELYEYLTGTMPEDTFFHWLETVLTSF